MSGVRTVRIRIEGRVQGVAYRAWTESQAEALGLAGWVRNRGDGSVEACVSGPEAAVAGMLSRCHDGPPAARVTRIAVLADDATPLADTGFRVRASR